MATVAGVPGRAAGGVSRGRSSISPTYVCCSRRCGLEVRPGGMAVEFVGARADLAQPAQRAGEFLIADRVVSVAALLQHAGGNFVFGQHEASAGDLVVKLLRVVSLRVVCFGIERDVCSDQIRSFRSIFLTADSLRKTHIRRVERREDVSAQNRLPQRS